MAEGSPPWAKLFPPVRVRQFVLTVPSTRRLLLARDPALWRGVHTTATGCIERRVTKVTGGGQAGSVSLTQRFGSSLRLDPHVHALVVDGGDLRDTDGGIQFGPARVHPSDAEALVVEIATACETRLAGQGHGLDEEQEKHAGVVVEAGDREGLLRLGRYLLGTVARPTPGPGPSGGLRRGEVVHVEV
jgi:hypothetical protein